MKYLFALLAGFMVYAIIKWICGLTGSDKIIAIVALFVLSIIPAALLLDND